MMPNPRISSLLALSTAMALALSGCGNGSHTANGPASSGTVTNPAPSSSLPAAAHSAPAVAASSQPAAVAASAPAVAAPVTAPVTALAASHNPQVSLVIGDTITADHRVTRAASSFKPSEKAFYASVSTNGKSVGGTLNAKWLYLEGKQPLVISSVSQLISAETPSSTTFAVHNPNPWPEGRYKVEVSLDGKSIASQEFQIH